MIWVETKLANGGAALGECHFMFMSHWFFDCLLCSCRAGRSEQVMLES